MVTMMQRKKKEERWNITQEAEDGWKESDNRRQWRDKHALEASRQTKEQLGLRASELCLRANEKSSKTQMNNGGRRALELQPRGLTGRRMTDGSESCPSTKQGCQDGDIRGSRTEEKRYKW